MKQKDILKKKNPCSIYHALHIDSSKERYCKINHIDARKLLEQSCGV